MDGVVEGGNVGESLVGEMMRLEVMPNDFNVVEFGRIFWQPLDGEPMSAGSQRRPREFTDVNRPIVWDKYDRLGRPARHGTKELVELFQMRDKVAAAFGWAGVDDEMPRAVIQRAQYRDLLCLSWRWHAQVGAGFGPGSGEIGMGQRLALIAKEQHDVAGLRLTLAQLQAQADPLDLAGDLPSFQGVPGPSVAELFFRNALDNCDRLMQTPSRAWTSARRRAIVQFGLSATGSSSKGVTMRKAAALFRGAGPGATLAFNASTPPLPKSLRHSRTVSSRTPKASAIRGLVQPESVSSTARARSASPRSRDPARAARATRCSSFAEIGDLSPMPSFPESSTIANRKTYPLVNRPESA